MSKSNSIRRAVRRALLSGAAASLAAAVPVQAQDANIQEIVVTGTRISVPGAESSSPILSVGAAEIESQLQPEVEKILRVLPITVPGDGQNANNGSAGAATVNLRGLGPQRNLVLINGKRATPYNYNGLVDTSTIPTALIERIDIVTGGASAVYGSDFDLYASYTLMDKVRVSLGIVDVFEKDPPVVGNEAADTTSNSGNTFPSSYNVLGRMYSLGVNMSF